MEGLRTGARTTPPRTFDRHASWAEHNWAWVLAIGIVAVALGVALIGSAFASLSALVWLAGLFLLFMGVAELLVHLRSERRGAHLIGAAIAVGGGLVLLVWPGQTLTVLAFVAGIAFAAWGVTSLAGVFRRRSVGGESTLWDVVAGAGLTALGVLMMAWPSGTVTVVGVLAGIVAVAWGVATALGAVELRRTGQRWEETRRLERERAELAWKDFEQSEQRQTSPGAKAA
jgi:uncharacterized membrane protein HdeD (DUF308 family)